MKKTAECIRNVSNWTTPAHKYVFDNKAFDKKQFADIMSKASPKLQSLLDKIAEVDASDQETHGRTFKHMIFTDVRSPYYGAKMIAAALAANDFRHVFDDQYQISLATHDRNFALLCSTPLYGKPISVRFRRELLSVYNARPDNTHGKNIRFIILDQGFKEGIDLHDVKYVHIFEPSITQADEKQTIGRATRLCGQKGLHFDPQLGWQLHVFRYDLQLPNEATLFQLFLQYSGIDKRKITFANNLEAMCVFGAVDYDLTRNVHAFNKAVPQSGGVRKRVNAPRKRKGFWHMRDYIKERFGDKYTWKAAEFENKCGVVGGMRIVEFNETQNFARMYFQPHSSYKGLLLWHSTGTGKCHAENTPILMYDGSVKNVQDIIVGDLLMGDDSTPRTVLSLAQGNDQMYTVESVDGSVKYTVNSEHILCVQPEGDTVNVIEVRADDYVNRGMNLYGYRVPVYFPYKQIGVDPYVIGYNGDPVPFDVICNDKQIQLEFIAGVVDSAASFDITCKNVATIRDIEFVCRSLGLLVYIDLDTMVCKIRGNVGMIPSRINVEYKNDMTTGLQYEIRVRESGQGKYYGFTIDGNNRYLLGDFTVTHNTCSAIAISSTSWERQGYNIVWVTRHTLKPEIWKNMYSQICSLTVRDKFRKGEIPKNARDHPMKQLSDKWLPPMSYKQFSNMLAGKNDYYKEMVKRNGETDILKNTLIIIDEAHKLFVNDVPPAERPDVDRIYKSILDSYELSGKDSARVLLMSATPYTSDPMQLIRLINLMKERKEHLPDDFDVFAQRYLTSQGGFSEDGKETFLDDISGYISYLNREKDARQFAYPVFHDVKVRISTSKKRVISKKVATISEVHSKLEKDVQDGKQAIKLAKQKIKEEKKSLEKQCVDVPRTEKRKCKEDVAKRAAVFESDLLGELTKKVDRDEIRLREIVTSMKQYKKEMKDAKNDVSVEAVLEEKCKVSMDTMV